MNQETLVRDIKSFRNELSRLENEKSFILGRLKAKGKEIKAIKNKILNLAAMLESQKED